MRNISIIVIVAALSVAAVGTSLAQDAAPAGPANAEARPNFHPSMADLMNMLVQPRHIKLGLAGQAKNWVYAAYEANELRGAFTRVQTTMPLYNRKIDIAPLIASTVDQPLMDVAAAAKAGDEKAFKTAYAQLTGACNACHLSVNHAPIVIKIPSASMYPDQDFTPTKIKPAKP